MALSLFAFRVDITLLTDGGQTVTQYTVSGHVCGCVPPPTVGMRYIHCVYASVHVWRLDVGPSIMCTHTPLGSGTRFRTPYQIGRSFLAVKLSLLSIRGP